MSFSEKHYYGLNSQGFHKIVYNEWGSEDDPVIVGVHGITCNAHDFDDLAGHLASLGYRFIAVDLPGRARSDDLPNPMDYNIFQYMRDITALFAHLGVDQPSSIDFIGVSLGGLIGICLSSLPNTPIKRFIINDVGPVVPIEMMEYIGKKVLPLQHFDSIQDLENHMRTEQRSGWGSLTDEQWHHMAEHNARALEDGYLAYNFDPDIAIAFNKANEEGGGDLWALWDQITCPVQLIRGGKSKILPKDIVQDMQKRGPGKDMDIVTFEDCGHAPSLLAPAHIEVIENWLAQS